MGSVQRTLAWFLVGVPVGLLVLCVVVFIVIGRSGLNNGCGQVGELKDGEVPKEFIPIYKGAAAKFELGVEGPAYLAAIHFVERSFGTGRAVSSQGAGGPMQFLTSTWDRYGVDADGDGKRDINSLKDAIYGAANYLHASGAPDNWHNAVFAYNHAEWYVAKVEANKNKFIAPLKSSSSLQAVDESLCSSLPFEASGPTQQRLLAIADVVAKAKIPYCYGAGHGVSPTYPTAGQWCRAEDGSQVSGNSTRGLDCSSSVSLLLQKAGIKVTTMTSGQFASWGKSGPGKFMTIYANGGHVFVKLGSRYWGTSGENYRHGPAWIAHPDSPSGYAVRHPEGL